MLRVPCGPGCLALLTLVVSSPAQTTHLVGPGGHPQITSAIAIASAGDTVLVQPGTYSMFQLNLPLTIRAAVPGTVNVTLGAFCSINPPNGTTVQFVGLRLGATGVGSGRLAMDACRFDPSTVSGGSAFGLQPATVALEADAASTVWLADSSLASTDPSLCPIAAGNGRQERCVLSPNCGALPVGPVLGVHQPAPLQTGALYALEFTTTPNAAVGVFIAPTLATTSHPTVEQALLLPGSAFSGGVLVGDAAGFATGFWFVPAGPQFVGLTAWFQAFSGPTMPLQASAVVGGVVR